MTAIAFNFNEDKVTAAASLFMELAGGEMDYFPLLKLLYLADRECLNELGRPISGDQLVSMRNGPALSRVYDLMKQTVFELPSTGHVWAQKIGRVDRYRLRLIGRPVDTLALSDAEAAIVAGVFEKFGKTSKWLLRDHTHRACPEWEDPGESSKPIEIEDLLRFLGKSQDEIEEVRENAEQEAFFDRVFAR